MIFIRHKKIFKRVVTTLIFFFTLGLTIPVFAASDSNNFTMLYTWQNEDLNSPAFPPVSEHFAQDQRVIGSHVSKTGFTIDNDKSTLVDNAGTGQTFSYSQALRSVGATSFDEYIDIANQTETFVPSTWLGKEEIFNTVLIPNNETVIVNYVTADGKKLGSASVATKFARTISIDQPQFDGYTVVANQPNSYKVDKDGDGANVVTITYEPVESSSSADSNSLNSSNSGIASSESLSNVDDSSVVANGQSSSVMMNDSKQQSNGQTTVVVPGKNNSSNDKSSSNRIGNNSPRHSSLPDTNAVGYMTSSIGVIFLAGLTIYFLLRR